MRHHNVVRKFGRRTGQRKQLFRSLATNLVSHGRIVTTVAKAKELRPYIEKLITIGKSGTLASKRTLVSRLGSKAAAKEITDVISKKYNERKGGYSRIVKLGERKGDASGMALIELI